MAIPSPSGIGFHEHLQTVPATIWTINHNLNYYPVVEVHTYDESNNLVKTFPLTLEHVSLNTVEVTFTVNRTGKVTCAAPLDIT